MVSKRMDHPEARRGFEAGPAVKEARRGIWLKFKLNMKTTPCHPVSRGSRFVCSVKRLLKVRSGFALFSCASVLSFGGAGCAQIGAGRPATATNAVAGTKPEIPVIKFTRLEGIPATTNRVTCILPCRNAPAAVYLHVLNKLGLNLDVPPGGHPGSLTLAGRGTDVRSAAAAMQALDQADDELNSIEIFPLKYAHAGELTAMVNELFAVTKVGRPRPPPLSGLQGNLAGAMPQLGGFEFGTNSRVFAKADSHGNSMIVSAPQDLIPIIRDLVVKLDQPVEGIPEIRLFKLTNADCADTALILARLFPAPNGPDATARPSKFSGGRGASAAMPFGAAGNIVESQYWTPPVPTIVEPDPRTQSLLVSASKDLMPQIENVISSLDNTPPSPHARPATTPPAGIEKDGPPGSAKGS
jgi:type II secretory pathway component GspD/PulD (secretin)